MYHEFSKRQTLNESISGSSVAIGELPEGAVFGDTSGLISESFEDKVKFKGYLTNYQARELSEQGITISLAGVVDSFSLLDFEPLGKGAYSYTQYSGKTIYAFTHDYRSKVLSCGSSAFLVVLYESKEFFFCHNVYKSEVDQSLVFLKIVRPDIKVQKNRDRHLGMALKDIEKEYQRGN